MPNRPATGEPARTVDVLSDVLRSVRLTGSMFFLVEATTPWMTQAPAANTFAGAVLPGAQHLISYHVVTGGSCWGGLAGQHPEPLSAGDVLVVPHGDRYFLAAPPDAATTYDDEEAVSFFRRMAAGELPTVVNEGGTGPDRTQVICGFLGCDVRPFNPIVAALPPVIHLRRAAGPGDRLSSLIDFAVAELRERRPGGRDVLLRLSELMFVEVLRCHIARSADAPDGWIAGLRDPLVARALALLHDRPAQQWNLASLAASVNTSRSTLSERFARFVGQPPMRYLTCWRMQVATRMLSDRRAKVRAVAEAVGYASEAAFSRAFKKHTGASATDSRRG